jgi:hypothetical protein
MTVVAFSPARFTSDDLVLFDAVAYPRIARGLWAGVSRNTCHDGDQILVTFPHHPLPVFRFELDRSGTYTLYFRSASSSEWSVIATGTSAAECLAIWTGRRVSA